MHNLDRFQTCPQPVVAPEFQPVTQSDGVMLVQVEMLVDLSSIFGMQFCTQNSAFLSPLVVSFLKKYAGYLLYYITSMFR